MIEGLRTDVVPFDALDARTLYALVHLRDLVFIVGQRISAVCEVDGEDPDATHVLAWGPLPRRGWEGAEAPAPLEASLRALADPRGGGRCLVGTARLFLGDDPVRVGRVAVHPWVQRRGVGAHVMSVVHDALAGRRAVMHAQRHLEGWYARLGWVRDGEPFVEAEIPHVTMVRPWRANGGGT